MSMNDELVGLADRLRRRSLSCALTTDGIAMRTYADELEALAARLPVEGWVSVEERLPERDGLGAVLAFDANRPRKGIWLESAHPSWWNGWMEACNQPGPDITHWRPLPAAPAPGGSTDGT